jgi:hypothetical protein
MNGGDLTRGGVRQGALGGCRNAWMRSDKAPMDRSYGRSPQGPLANTPTPAKPHAFMRAVALK